MPQPGGGRARRGDGGRLVHRRYRNRLFKGAVVPPVIRPHRHLVHVVPVRVGRAFVVRRVAESQLTLFVHDEVPAVPARGIPSGDLGAGVFRVNGHVPAQHLGLAVVFRHAARGTANPGNLRSLVHVRNGYGEGQTVGVAVFVDGHHRQFVVILPVRIRGALKVRRAYEGQFAAVAERKGAGVRPRVRPGNGASLRVGGAEVIDR